MAAKKKAAKRKTAKKATKKAAPKKYTDLEIKAGLYVYKSGLNYVFLNRKDQRIKTFKTHAAAIKYAAKNIHLIDMPTKKAAPKKATKKAAPKKATKKAAPKKSAAAKCASAMGRKGGLATKRLKKGIFSATYKAKRKKAAAKKKK